VVIVPSMHKGLWDNPILRDALVKLSRAGALIIPPLLLEGKAKFPPLEDIVSAVEALALRGQDLKGLKILITAGPTREWMDSVRFLTNPSSGLMGIELARNAYFRGAEVTLVHGPTRYSVPYYVRTVRVETTDDMLNVCVKEAERTQYDAVILAGAPSDFKFERRIKGKIPSLGGAEPPSLVPAPKISKALRKVFKGLLVGFAAEASNGRVEELLKKAELKMEERCFDIMVANDISKEGIGFNSLYNEVIIIKKGGGRDLIKKSMKSFIAMRVLDSVLEELRK